MTDDATIEEATKHTHSPLLCEAAMDSLVGIATRRGEERDKAVEAEKAAQLYAGKLRSIAAELTGKLADSEIEHAEALAKADADHNLTHETWRRAADKAAEERDALAEERDRLDRANAAGAEALKKARVAQAAAEKERDALAEKNRKLREEYSELILAVGNKYPGETRHQTALRYIRQAEAPDDNMANCKTALSGGTE